MEKKPFNQGAQPMRNNNGQQRKGQDKNNKDFHAINDQIRAREVRLVGDNVENGVFHSGSSSHRR